ncbi:MAG: hypothetical protein BGP16_05005 [Sphingobium sp. 66-54]|nr:MAG: hypothetical protein BGP16_05005 [Sphingobium sp. 66-54]
MPAVAAILARYDRASLEAFLSVAIDLLDAMDGDPDVEDDDPSGDTLDISGEAPTDNGAEMYAIRPVYSVDQSRGPINEAEAHREHMRELLRH